jgi:4-amino-4-deoxy-L-arabinose transferase-like glycosyltransferase
VADIALLPARATSEEKPSDKPHWFDRWWKMIVAAVLIANLVVLLWNIGGYPAPFDDEGTYVSQAWAVIERSELSHYTYWYDHPPVGWLLLVPWLWVTDAFGAVSPLLHGRVFMALVAVASAFLVYLLARRLGLRRGFALLSVVLFGFSPLAVFFQRMVLLDNLALLLVLGAFAFLASPRRKLWEQQAGVALFAVAGLTKETMLLLVPVVVLFLWQGSDRSNRRYSLGLAASIFISLLLLYPVFAALRGELLPGEGHVSLLEAIQYQLFSREGSGSIVDPSSPRFELIASWLRLDWWLPALGLIAAPMALYMKPLRPIAVGTVMIVLGVVRPGYLPAMFVIAALPLFALQVAGVLDALWGTTDGRHGRIKRPVLTRAGHGVAAVSVALIAVFVAPTWASALQRQMSQDDAAEHRQTREWLLDSVAPGSPILVDNVLWLDLVIAGYPTDSTVWFYKLDLDPSVADRFPGGASDFEYVVSTPLMRTVQYSLPTVSSAIRASEVVRAIGGVEIRTIQ